MKSFENIEVDISKNIETENNENDISVEFLKSSDDFLNFIINVF